ncbi:MAG: hypothetical protein ACRETW_11650 [Stenotrophobium sp.]
MKIKTLLLWILVLALGGAGYAEYRLAAQVTQAAGAFVYKARPWAIIRYQRQLPFLWGGGRAWGLDIEPAGDLRRLLGVPIGYHFTVDELRVHQLSLNPDGTLALLKFSLMGLRAPVLETQSTKFIVNDQWWRAVPTLSELGIQELRLDADVTLRYDPATQSLRCAVNLLAPNLGNLYLDQDYGAGSEVFDGVFKNIALRSLTLEYADLGWLRQVKELLAQRNRMDTDAFEIATITSLGQYAIMQKWKWDDASEEALRHFVRDPSYGRLTLSPVYDVMLQNLRLYAPGDWFGLLAARFGTEGKFNHPLPGDALP